MDKYFNIIIQHYGYIEGGDTKHGDRESRHDTVDFVDCLEPPIQQEHRIKASD
jgi:hypothetical protein